MKVMFVSARYKSLYINTIYINKYQQILASHKFLDMDKAFVVLNI